MIRNLKALGLALFAFLAFGAMATASASAQETLGEIYETAGKYPVHIHGEDVPPTAGEAIPSFTANEITVECTETTYTGNIEKEEKTLTITPTYKKCWADAAHETTPATVTMNECDYSFHHLTTKPEQSTDNWSVTVDLKCPVGKVVEIHRYSSVANHEAGTSNCTMTLAESEANKNMAGITVYEETNPDALRLEHSVEPTAQTHGACSFGLTLNVKTTLHVSATVKGTEEKEIAITH